MPMPDWMRRAACRAADPELFYPTGGDAVAIAAAKDICAGCPVVAECLEYAIANNEQYGVWGALTPEERRAISRRDMRRRRSEAIWRATRNRGNAYRGS